MIWCRTIAENRSELRCVTGFQLCRDNSLMSHPALLVFLQLFQSCIAHWQLRMWSVFVLIPRWCVTCWRLYQGVNLQPHFICYKCLLFSSYCFGRNVTIPAGTRTIVSTSAVQCPLDVGVVASVTTGWKKECWPLTLPSGDPRPPPLAVGYRKHSLRTRLRFNQREVEWW